MIRSNSTDGVLGDRQDRHAEEVAAAVLSKIATGSSPDSLSDR